VVEYVKYAEDYLSGEEDVQGAAEADYVAVVSNDFFDT
jgi:hypothetical protein